MSIQSGADSAPESAQRAVRWVALVVLSGLTVTGFAVSYTRLHGFMGRYGEEGWTAYASAGMVDSLALSGLLVALVFRDWWARAAFVLALGFTGFANAFVGFQFASWFGLVVGLVPILSMELAYRIALSLMLPEPGQAPSALPDEPGQAEPDVSTVVLLDADERTATPDEAGHGEDEPDSPRPPERTEPDEPPAVVRPNADEPGQPDELSAAAAGVSGPTELVRLLQARGVAPDELVSVAVSVRPDIKPDSVRRVVRRLSAPAPA